MNLEDLFNRLQGKRIVSQSHLKDRAAIEYSVVLTNAEYEELEEKVKESQGDEEKLIHSRSPRKAKQNR